MNAEPSRRLGVAHFSGVSTGMYQLQASMGTIFGGKKCFLKERQWQGKQARSCDRKHSFKIFFKTKMKRIRDISNSSTPLANSMMMVIQTGC